MTLSAQQNNPDGSLTISSTRGGGNAWRVEPDPEWGIKITALGSSLIPLCPDVLDRPHIIERQRKGLNIQTYEVLGHVLDTFITSALKELGQEPFILLPEQRLEKLKEIMIGLQRAVAAQTTVPPASVRPAIPTREEIVVLAAAAFDAKIAHKAADSAYESYRIASPMGVKTAELCADSEIRKAKLLKVLTDAEFTLRRAELALRRAAYLHANGIPLPE